MSIRTKILGGFLIVSLLGIALGITGLISAQLTQTRMNELRGILNYSGEFSDILKAHYSWRNGLSETIITGEEFKGSLDPKTCMLGQWMNSDSARELHDPKIDVMLTALTAPHNLIHNEASNVLNLLNAGDKEGAINIYTTTIQPGFNEVIADLTAMGDHFDELADVLDMEANNITNTTTAIIIALIVVVLGVCVFLAILISGMISKPLALLSSSMKNASATGNIAFNEDDAQNIGKHSSGKDEVSQTINACAMFVQRIMAVSDLLATISDGDLTNDIDLLSDKDTMGTSIHNLFEGLNSMFTEIRGAAEQVYSGAKQMADGAQSLAQGSTEQAASIEELSSSIADIAEKTKINANMAEKAANLADTIKGNAEKGSKQMGEMMQAVNEINEASGSIGKVIQVIDDIAFQTNILALNAAVEAARAGQHGKGFAVVAEEVRNLAAKSAEAAKDTSGLIDNTIEKANFGARIAHDTAESLKEIVTGINESNQLIGEIARSSEEQSLNIGQINEGIDQVAVVVQHNSATAQEEAAASQEMSSQAATLQDLVAQFKLKSGSEKRIAAQSSSNASGSGARRLFAPQEPALVYPSGGGDFGKF